MASSSAGLNVVLLGKTGAGKSASGNTILGREVFESHKSPMSLTRDVKMESGSVDGFPVDVYDTPGLLNTDMSEEELNQKYEALLRECKSGPCVFLLVIKADRFTAEERETVEKIEKLLGEKHLKKTWILFTRGDELEEENVTIETFINDTERLKTLVKKYEQRYHVFNNRKRGDTEQVKTLFTKLKASLEKGSRGLRIILLGQAGVGKSASGNTIMGQDVFTGGSVKKLSSVASVCLKVDATVSDGSVEKTSSETHVYSELQATVLDRSVNERNSVTFAFSEVQATVSGRSVSVVDTPGLFDRNTTHFDMNNEHLVRDINREIYLSSPGAHAFLIVLPVNVRLAEEYLWFPEQWFLRNICKMFGQEVLKYSIILFTHGDQLEDQTIEELIKRNRMLKCLVDQCGGRYQLFNNKAVNNRDQVNELLQKIDSMIEQNGGGHYSNQMNEDTHRQWESTLHLFRMTEGMQQITVRPRQHQGQYIRSRQRRLKLAFGKEESRLLKRQCLMELGAEYSRLRHTLHMVGLEEEEIKLKQRLHTVGLKQEEENKRERMTGQGEKKRRKEQRLRMMELELEEEERRLVQRLCVLELEEEEHRLEQRLHMMAIEKEECSLRQRLHMMEEKIERLFMMRHEDEKSRLELREHKMEECRLRERLHMMVLKQKRVRLRQRLHTVALEQKRITLIQRQHVMEEEGFGIVFVMRGQEEKSRLEQRQRMMELEERKLRRRLHMTELEEERIRQRLHMRRLKEGESSREQRRCMMELMEYERHNMMALEAEEEEVNERLHMMTLGEEEEEVYERLHMMTLKEEEVYERLHMMALEEEEEEVYERLHMMALKEEDGLKQMLYMITLTQKER